MTDLLEKYLNEKALPALMDFIRIPNLTRGCDPAWDTNGLAEQACRFCIDFALSMAVKGLTIDQFKDAGKTATVFGTVESTRAGPHKNLMFYGHLDKQPHMTDKWREGLHPTKPVIEDKKLYGRGGTDDGYNFLTTICLIKVLQDLGIPHDRFILFYETDEESASRDIPYYLKKFEKEIGIPDCLFCLDGGAPTNKVLNLVTSIRGFLNFDLKVQVLQQGVHSGLGSGIVPSSFRIARLLLDRIEDPITGKVVDALQAPFPEDKMQQAKVALELMGDLLYRVPSKCKGVSNTSEDPESVYLNKAAYSQLDVMAQDGIPHLSSCGNVLRPFTTLRCGMRLAPTLCSTKAFATVKDLLTKDPPYGALVEVTKNNAGNGWSSHEIPQTVLQIFDRHSLTFFGKKTLLQGAGAAMPLVNIIQDGLPSTTVFVTGCVLPTSFIHAPNENLDIEYWLAFSKTLASFVVDYGLV